MKRYVATFLAFVMILSVFAGCAKKQDPTESTQQPSQEKNLKMAMITDTGGLGDNGFNDMAWSGMEQARDELGFEIGLIESTEAAQYVTNISAAADQGYDIIVCVGYLLEDALAEVAPKYPDKSFVMIDGSVDGDNIYSFVYDMQEASFLAGALTAYEMPECKTFGSVGGMEIPDVVAWETGFVTGIRTINPDAKVLISYVGSFADPGIAKELALAQFDQGAGAIIEISSGGAIGVIEAAQESGNKFVATDMSKDNLAPGCELAAALAGRDKAVLEAAREIKEGTAKAGTTRLSMKDGVFDVPDYVGEKYGDKAVALVEMLKQKVIDGEIVVPRTKEDLAAFQPPELQLP